MAPTRLDMTFKDENGRVHKLFLPTVEQTKLCLQDWDDVYHHAYQELDEVLAKYDLTLEDLGLERLYYTKHDIQPQNGAN